jgi:RNA polymerase sigma-70 factor (ECF subfamily)
MPQQHAKPDSPDGRAPDRQRFAREVERLMDRLYGTALRLTRDPDDAEDIVADAVSNAWARLDQLRDDQCLEAWLFRILNNTFIDAWRGRRSRQDKETGLDTTDEGEQHFSLYRKLHQPFLLWWGTPEEQFLNDLLQEDIQAALDSLPDTFRIVVMLVEVCGHTYEEAAGMLAVPLGTVRSRLNRGRGLLQKALWQQAREAGLTGAAGRSQPKKEAKDESA